jgi:hypothetical protein
MATTKKGTEPARPAAELRVYLTLTDLQPQFSSWMSSPLGARGYVAMQGTNALLVEIAPGLSIQRVIDLALKAEPTLEPGILAVERQFGVLEYSVQARSFWTGWARSPKTSCARICCTATFWKT